MKPMKSTIFRKAIFLMLVPIAFYFYICGWDILNPKSISWLLDEDPAQQYLSWIAFKNDVWRFPLGLNPNFGLEVSSSIIFSDVIPIFAIVFKAVSKFFEADFQYVGLWILLCFVLQFHFSRKLISIYSESKLVQFIFASVCLFLPSMLWRLHGHHSLVAHFQIIAAIFLIERRSQRKANLYWSLLIALSILTHAYIFIMVFSLWLTYLLKTKINKGIPLFKIAKRFIFMMLFIFLVAYISGYFVIDGGGLSGGFGYYKMNLLSIFDSEGVWSNFFGDIPNSPGEYEGFNYLGLGIIFLLITALILSMMNWQSVFHKIKRKIYYFPLVIGFFLLAITNTVGVAGDEFKFELISGVEGVLGIFRASGRFFWPISYLIILGSFSIIITYLNKRFSKSFLLFALVIQVADLNAGFNYLRNMFSERFESPRLAVSEFWAKTPECYDYLKAVPINNKIPEWLKLSIISKRYDLQTNAVYTARMGPKSIEEFNSKTLRLLSDGIIENDTIYVIRNKSVFEKALKENIYGFDFWKVDGLYLVAKHCSIANVNALDSYNVTIADMYSSLIFNENIIFDKVTAEGYLMGGWYNIEPWGVWSKDKESQIGFKIPKKRGLKISLKLTSIISDSDSEFVKISVNDNIIGKFDMGTLNRKTLTFNVPESYITKEGIVNIEFITSNVVSPFDVGLNGDRRELGIGLISMYVQTLEKKLEVEQ